MNVPLGLYVVSIGINFIRFNHSVPFGLMSPEQQPAVRGTALQQHPLEVSAFPLASDMIQSFLPEAVENGVCGCRATRWSSGKVGAERWLTIWWSMEGEEDRQP